MKNMKIKFRTAFVVVALLVLTIGFNFNSIAQIDPPPPDGCVDPLDPACPIDGGLVLLIAAGIGIGAKNARRKK
jgi:hypothetical protein